MQSRKQPLPLGDYRAVSHVVIAVDLGLRREVVVVTFLLLRSQANVLKAILKIQFCCRAYTVQFWSRAPVSSVLDSSQ